MKYVIMCGGTYNNFEEPKQFFKINGERLVDRTIRLLRENGVEDIVITSNNPAFDSCGVPRVSDENNTFSQDKSWTNMKGFWLDAYYRFNEPTCYLHGDVFYSQKAIKTIVETTPSEFVLFGTNPAATTPNRRIKPWVEPLGFKVVNYETFYSGIDAVKLLFIQKRTRRHPISWELYRYLCGYNINSSRLEKNWVCINDISNDIDSPQDAALIERLLNTRGEDLIQDTEK